jgi:PTH1 family peptidyl-tRNA hydrolase
MVIIGLGNPGDEYVGTRHNTGRMILEAFRKTQEFPEWQFDKKINSEVSEGKIKKEKIVLLCPDTFMNKSGNAAVKFIKSKKAAEKLVVIHDDLDLPLGRFKIVFNRGSGGHRGVESIMRAIGTEGFVRIKVGISKDAGKGRVKKPVGEKAVGDFILGKFKPAEETELKKIAKKVSEALELVATDGREAAMGAFN